MEALASETHNLEYEQQLRNDLQTQFAELVDGNMRTSFELYFVDGDLIGEDGRSMSQISQKSLADAKEIVKAKPNLWFEVRRRGLEAEEIDLALEMAKNQGPNTMVIVSDFPAELMGATEDVGGYNVTRKQTMLRILTREANSNLHMYSQSLDGSNRGALEAVYHHLGFIPEAGELLGQRIQLDLSTDRRALLVDELMGVYDHQLANQYGGEWHGGRRPADYRNTYDFVCQQTDLIEECIRLNRSSWLNQSFMYDIAATMNRRFKSRTQHHDFFTPSHQTTRTALHHEIQQAGIQAREMGLSFSACGATLKAEGPDNSLENKLELAGYGNKTSEATEYKFDKKMHCVVCQDPPKKGEAKKMCGPCGICESCDKKLQKQG